MSTISQSTISRIGRYIIYPILGVLSCAAGLKAQAPTDEWRRPGLDPMLAEPSQAASLLPNPAGLVSKEERKRSDSAIHARTLKQEYITEILSFGMFVDFDLVDILTDPEMASRVVREHLGVITSVTNLLGGGGSANTSTLNLLRGLNANDYNRVVAGTNVLNGKSPTTVNLQDLENEVRGGNIAAIATNLQADRSLVRAIADSMGQVLLEDLGPMGVEWYSRLFGLSYADSSRPLAWGIYFGLEQTAVLRLNTPYIGMPLNMNIDGIELETTLAIGLKFYLLAPLRLALATDFGEAIPGFSFGIGFKVVPYNGFNQYSFGRYLFDGIDASGLDVNFEKILKGFYHSSGLNLGIDLGLQYHFGAISPWLNFLHAGLKISDVVGFNIPLYSGTDPFRYALDFDFGLYAEQLLSRTVQLFGGAELIQIRGMVLEPSPYSALYEPIDHLRLLLGVALLDNVLRFTLQYYNSSLSLGAMVNVGVLQVALGLTLNTAIDQTWGMDFTIRFRSPHDGFNPQEPYRSYSRKVRAKEIQKTEEDTQETDNI